MNSSSRNLYFPFLLISCMAFGLVLSALAGNGPGGDQQNDTFPLEREIRHDGYHVSIPVSPDTAYIIQPSFGAIDHGGDGSNHHYTWNSDCHEKDCVTIVVGDTTKQWPKSPTGINCFSDRDEAFNAWTGTCVVVNSGSATSMEIFFDDIAYWDNAGSCKVKVSVLKVDNITASCPEADNSPQVFEGHETDFGDPCAATDPGQALIIFYDEVLDENFLVEDFEITLQANIQPDSITEAQLDESWAKVNGPASGDLNQTNSFEVKYQNPKVGGLFQFEFDLGLSGCAKSGANVCLPLAGADMTGYLDLETKGIKGWAVMHKAEVRLANDSPVPFVTLHRVYDTWCSISGSYFDYIFDPVDAEEYSPCRRFQPEIGSNGRYGYLTVNGVVVHGSKINNMLWSLFGRYWGFSESSLRAGAYLNEGARRLRVDDATSQNAICLADDIYHRPLADIAIVLTKSKLRTLQDPDELDEEKLWPSPYRIDKDKSTFVRPTLPTTPEE